LIRFSRTVVVLSSLCLVGAVPARVWAEESSQPDVTLATSAARPSALIPLYASLVALEALDAHSTWRALDNGLQESNPVLTGVAGNKPAFVAAKIGVTAATIALTEQLRKKNRAAAIILMVSANSGMAWVVNHNYRAVR